MIIYAESSAILAWLLREPAQAKVVKQLNGATRVVASSLTIAECARGIVRAAAANRLSEMEELTAVRLLDNAESSWFVHDLTGPVLARARARFPHEPIRTLDALHLATALVFQETLGGITMLSFDERVRANAKALGMLVSPNV